MKSVTLFKEFHKANFTSENSTTNSDSFFHEYIADFVEYIPLKMSILNSYIEERKIDYFYNSIADLKYLIEFSEDFNKYWYILRAYSSTISKLMVNPNIKNSKKIYNHYFSKYGDRRALREENAFEKKRWEFLDELNTINTEQELQVFINKYNKVLAENWITYSSFIYHFIHELKNSFLK